MARLRRRTDFNDFRTVRLDRLGRLLDGDDPVPEADVPKVVSEQLAIPDSTSDIFVLVHGWQHDERSAARFAARLFDAAWTMWRDRQTSYSALRNYLPFFVSVHWPSKSIPFSRGYRRIRDRAHAMTTAGDAAYVLAALLGYLDQARERPQEVAGTLRTASGTFLHCVGHSFGCRLLGEAIMLAAEPPPGRTLGWPWELDFPFAVDTFLGLQMAAPPDIFNSRFKPLVSGEAPIAGPVVLTFSPHDLALSTWHRVPEGKPGLGATGAVGWPTIALRRSDSDYRADEFHKLTNVDAGWRYQQWWNLFTGAHSAFWYPETVHLLLSLANLSR